MRRRPRHNKKRVLAAATVLGATALAFQVAGWTASAPSESGLSPSENIALRFPDSRFDVWDKADAPAATIADDTEQLALFSPHPTLPPPSANVVATISVRPDQTGAIAPKPTAGVATMPPAKPEADVQARTVKLASAQSRPAAPRTRPGAVLNDAQIANIKARLRLTREQQEMWPAVESALRGLSYTKNADRFEGRNARGTIDPYSDEVRQLKSAAFPLIMSFSDEQKRELRVIAHVAGLEKLAAQF